MKKYSTILGEDKLQMFQTELSQNNQQLIIGSKTIRQQYQQTYVLCATQISHIPIDKITSYFQQYNTYAYSCVKAYPKIDSVYVNQQKDLMLLIFVISQIDPENLKNDLQQRISFKIDKLKEEIYNLELVPNEQPGKENDTNLQNQMEDWQHLSGNKKFYQSIVVVEKNGRSLKVIDQTENLQFNYKKMRYRPRRANCQYKSICLGQIYEKNR